MIVVVITYEVLFTKFCETVPGVVCNSLCGVCDFLNFFSIKRRLDHDIRVIRCGNMLEFQNPSLLHKPLIAGVHRQKLQALRKSWIKTFLIIVTKMKH